MAVVSGSSLANVTRKLTSGQGRRPGREPRGQAGWHVAGRQGGGAAQVPSPPPTARAPHPGAGHAEWLPLTCQAAVDHVMLLPKPEDCLVRGFHGIHRFFSHFLKMLTAFLTPEEDVNVPPDGLQHCLGVVFKPCGGTKACRTISTRTAGTGVASGEPGTS